MILRALTIGAAFSLALTSTLSAETIKIGLIAPLSGPGAPWGMAAKVAGETVAERVNAEGGLDVGGVKQQIEIIAYDDQYKAAEAAAAYNRLVNEDEARYLVLVTSASTLAVKQNVEDDEIVSLTASYSPAAIDDGSKFMFRLYSTADDYMPAYAAWMKDNLTERKMATLNPNDETGWSHREVTHHSYEENGFEIVGGELYERSIKDFAPLLTKILALRPEVIDLGSSSPATSGLIVRQARELGFGGRFVQTGGTGWPTVVEAAGKEAAEGMVNILYADPLNPAYQEVITAYAAKVGQAPNEIIVSFHDGYRVLLAAIQEAGDAEDTGKVAEAFSRVLPMPSLQGDDMTWEHQQIRTYDYVGIITDGSPVVQDKVK